MNIQTRGLILGIYVGTVGIHTLIWIRLGSGVSFRELLEVLLLSEGQVSTTAYAVLVGLSVLLAYRHSKFFEPSPESSKVNLGLGVVAAFVAAIFFTPLIYAPYLIAIPLLAIEIPRSRNAI